uniref:Uncharacterized protein n=1 Tax=Timema poppense TaxID=170557 RepID=A0A7R9H917_TIMPO|nr:unnamed protein product [Timema poppensis]
MEWITRQSNANSTSSLSSGARLLTPMNYWYSKKKLHYVGPQSNRTDRAAAAVSNEVRINVLEDRLQLSTKDIEIKTYRIVMFWILFRNLKKLDVTNKKRMVRAVLNEVAQVEILSHYMAKPNSSLREVSSPTIVSIALYLTFKGVAKVHWTETRTVRRTGQGGPHSVNVTENYTSEEIYFNNSVYKSSKTAYGQCEAERFARLTTHVRLKASISGMNRARCTSRAVRSALPRYVHNISAKATFSFYYSPPAETLPTFVSVPLPAFLSSSSSPSLSLSLSSPLSLVSPPLRSLALCLFSLCPSLRLSRSSLMYSALALSEASVASLPRNIQRVGSLRIPPPVSPALPASSVFLSQAYGHISIQRVPGYPPNCIHPTQIRPIPSSLRIIVAPHGQLGPCNCDNSYEFSLPLYKVPAVYRSTVYSRHGIPFSHRDGFLHRILQGRRQILGFDVDINTIFYLSVPMDEFFKGSPSPACSSCIISSVPFDRHPTMPHRRLGIGIDSNYEWLASVHPTQYFHLVQVRFNWMPKMKVQVRHHNHAEASSQLHTGYPLVT